MFSRKLFLCLLFCAVPIFGMQSQYENHHDYDGKVHRYHAKSRGFRRRKYHRLDSRKHIEKFEQKTNKKYALNRAVKVKNARYRKQLLKSIKHAWRHHAKMEMSDLDEYSINEHFEENVSSTNTVPLLIDSDGFSCSEGSCDCSLCATSDSYDPSLHNDSNSEHSIDSTNEQN